MLAAQIAVGILAGDHHGGGFQAGFIAVLVVQGLTLEVVPVTPVLIHPKEHGRPILGFGAAGAGMDGEHTVVGVVFTGEQGGQAGGLDVLLQFGVALLQLRYHGVVIRFLPHFAQHQQIFYGVQPLLLGVQLVLEILDALGDFLRLLHVVPKILCCALCLQ